MAGRPHAGADYSNSDYDIAIRDICARADAPLHEDLRLSHPGEPIYMPRRRGSSFWRALVVSLALGAGGWGLLNSQEFWLPYANQLASATMAALERASARDDVQPAPAKVVAEATNMPPAEPIATRDIIDAPHVGAGTPVAGAPKGEANASSVDAGGGAASAAADAGEGADASAGSTERGDGDAGKGGAAQNDVTLLPPPQVDPTDPYQKRALAVGLHPELSRVLLSRLSDADYRNAGIAIKKAVAELGDGDKLVWPKQREPKLALFKVHFVAGAPADCRRYVVVVTKDGWSTTAQPMERCGVKRVARQSS